MTYRIPLVLVLAAAMLICRTSQSAADESRVGRQIDGFTLADQWGKQHALADYRDSPLVVAAFLGTECPLAKLYAPRLVELAETYGPQGVTFLGIVSNQQDSIAEMVAFARRNGIEFPLLKDTGNTVADQFAAIRTPEVFVLDAQRVVRYWGRIDDQYGFAEGVGYQRPDASRNDLAAALDELLVGKPVSVSVTEAVGCHIGRVRTPVEDSPVTYSDQIARLIQHHCLDCHREGQIGPFAMDRYEEVVGWGEMIREVVEQERMPPWHANPAYGEFLNDARLTDEEKELIYRWVDDGCPEGDPADLPPTKEYTVGWGIGEPDEIIYMRDEPFDVPAEGVVDYQYFTVDPGWTEDKYIKIAETRPGSYATVHHIIVFIDAPGAGSGRLSVGSILSAYVPGRVPTFDGRTGALVKAGSKLRFQVHYTTNGKPQQDRSYVGIVYADPAELEYIGHSGLVANVGFRIPPGDDNYKAVASRTFRRDTMLTHFIPHMHTRGKSFRYEAVYPDGTSEILLDVPRFDFNWQSTYQLAEPKKLPAGTKLLCTAHWDNSEDNLSNPDPTATVTWGDQTWEEMMIGWYVEAEPNERYRPKP